MIIVSGENIYPIEIEQYTNNKRNKVGNCKFNTDKIIK